MRRFDPALFPETADFFVEDDEETETCREMGREARVYITKFRWAKAIEEERVGFCYPGVIGAYAIRVSSTNPSVPPWVWVVVGDLPPIYFDADEAATPADVLRRYVDLMGRWVEAVRGEVEFDDSVAPVNVPPTPQNADKLEWRLNFLADQILPELIDLA